MDIAIHTFPLIPFTGSFLLLNFRPLYKNVEHVWHCIENGSIIRTGIKSSYIFVHMMC